MHAGRTARISLDSSKSPEKEQQLQVKPASEHVGAEIIEVNLAVMPNGVFEKIEDAYNRYSLLIFRDQELSPEQQIAFARRFGELEISPRTQFALPGHPGSRVRFERTQADFSRRTDDGSKGSSVASIMGKSIRSPALSPPV